MRAVFLDTSALVKRYIHEDGSEWIAGLFEKSVDTLFYIAEITTVELTSTVCRRLQANQQALEQAEQILNDFDLHLVKELIVLDIESALISDARLLVRNHRLRAYDAIQLATAERLNRREITRNLPGVTLVSADTEMLDAASAIGLATENPSDHK
jgi:predicted nucleic acid-binding protein